MLLTSTLPYSETTDAARESNIADDDSTMESSSSSESKKGGSHPDHTHTASFNSGHPHHTFYDGKPYQHFPYGTGHGHGIGSISHSGHHNNHGHGPEGPLSHAHGYANTFYRPGVTGVRPVPVGNPMPPKPAPYGKGVGKAAGKARGKRSRRRI